ncbi:LysR family transcriptional regulator [Shinella sp. WSJ-2]|uniref:LysR family transcriptional regulator n=1 Tax=Shinella sp. WSJ-2 TaxID=2303749 RepID=UPI000E3EB8FB|nr:LysR family transcriptional regulator [Shinella sp. WSJ-2]RFZ83864.1 LysR family transcriptional regulator [Shinella sp. WSJ-2]
MPAENLRDLHAFTTVAEEGSFTRAAARLGVSQSALSQSIRGLEERLGMRLLSRTTRSVAPTEAGERLLAKIGPALREIDEGVASLSELRDRPAGTIRISADEFAVHHVLWPAIEQLAPVYPDISFEITADYGLTDIVSGRYDAGIRRGGLVSQDMAAVRISPDTRMAVVASPIYLRDRRALHAPQDLTAHSCINLRLPTHGEYFAWTFRKGGKEQRIRVTGQFVFNTLSCVHQAALSGFGLAYLPEEQARPDLERGALVEVLANWRQTFEGYHIYYPHRRHPSPAFALLVDALKRRMTTR